MSRIDRAIRSNIKLRHLQLLVALDQFRHLGRAAEFLSLTQPAVSKTLAELESLFGVRLFDRSTRGTEPTAYGDSVVRFARTVLAGYQRTREEIASMASGAAGRTSVGAMVVALPLMLGQAIDRLKARSPLTTVLVEEGDLTRLLPRLRLGELELFIGRLEPGYAAPDLDTEVLFNEPMSIVVAPDHPLAAVARPAWKALAALPWVMPPPWASLRVKLEQVFLAKGLQPPGDTVETASFLALHTVVRSRGAAALMARSVARHFERERLVRVLPVRVPVELPPVGIITMRGRRNSPSADRLIECLRAVAPRS
ncbi:MAG: LysR family transcriptional regulator [Burkholderiaceae bacterium]|nr:LysR family transcriptional regulator [Burkholderiaceae bacterium]MBP7660589.1 LysR family transcriptional regulator [Burkholderiaceae bacterium]